HHQYDGSAQPLRDLRRRALLARAVDPVEAPHHALGHGQVRVLGLASDARLHRPVSAHPAVEVVRRAPSCERVEARIDEVGPHLERLHPEAARSQRFEQAERDRCLAHAARHPCDDDHTRCHRRRSSAGFAGAILSRRVAPTRITPTSPAISKPPTPARTSTPSPGSGAFTASARRTTSTLRANAVSSTPVPRPVTRSGAAPVIAAVIALAAVVLPIPI